MEIWKDIKGYEGLYQVSNLGNVKNLKRKVKISKTLEKYKEIPEHILKPIKNKCGYLYVSLANNGKIKNVRVHKLVAEAFIPNDNKILQINHINGLKSDNRVENLEWVTCKDNINKAWEMGLCEKNRELLRKNIIERNHKRDYSKTQYKTSVLQYDLEGNLIKRYKSLSDAGRQNNVNATTIAYRIKNGDKKGYMWKYENI